MSTLELNGKDFATQTSSAEPVLASTVTGGAGLMPTGVTSLGTVTAGNLSNTAIVYPTGHSIQTKMTQIGTPVTGISTISAINEVHADLRIDFTPYFSTSKILFLFHAGNCIAQSADLLTSIRYHSSSDTAPNTAFGNDLTSGDRQGSNAQIFTYNHITFENAWSGLRCVSPCYGSSNGQSVCISNGSHVTSFIIQEISA